jgi:hypothetical protein
MPQNIHSYRIQKDGILKRTFEKLSNFALRHPYLTHIAAVSSNFLVFYLFFSLARLLPNIATEIMTVGVVVFLAWGIYSLSFSIKNYRKSIGDT